MSIDILCISGNVSAVFAEYTATQLYYPLLTQIPFLLPQPRRKLNCGVTELLYTPQ